MEKYFWCKEAVRGNQSKLNYVGHQHSSEISPAGEKMESISKKGRTFIRTQWYEKSKMFWVRYEILTTKELDNELSLFFLPSFLTILDYWSGNDSDRSTSISYHIFYYQFLNAFQTEVEVVGSPCINFFTWGMKALLLLEGLCRRKLSEFMTNLSFNDLTMNKERFKEISK